MRHIPKLMAALGSVMIGILGFQGAAGAQVNWGTVPQHQHHHHHFPVTGYPGPICKHIGHLWLTVFGFQGGKGQHFQTTFFSCHGGKGHHHIQTTGFGGHGGTGGGWKLLSSTHHIGF